MSKKITILMFLSILLHGCAGTNSTSPPKFDPPPEVALGAEASGKKWWNEDNVPIRPGKYKIRMTNSQSDGHNVTETGYLILRVSMPDDKSPKTGEKPTELGMMKFPLYGWIELNWGKISAPVSYKGSLSKDPIYPGVLVDFEHDLKNDKQITLLIGTVNQTRRCSLTTMMTDGSGIAIHVTKVSKRVFRGEWGAYGLFPGGLGKFKAKYLGSE